MERQFFSKLLGLDLGNVNTRASIMGVRDEKFCLLDSERALTSLGQGLNLGTGAGDAMRQLQNRSSHILLEKSGKLIMPSNSGGIGVDKVALTTSLGPLPRIILLGLTASGSLQAGRNLVDSLSVTLLASFGMDVLVNEPYIIAELLHALPELLILTGGEDAGAEQALIRWIDVLRIYYSLALHSIKPVFLYAGNPQLENQVRRRLEPVAKLRITANLQPHVGELDLNPAKVILDQEILGFLKNKLPGMAALSAYSKDLEGTKAFGLDRMVRYLSLKSPSDQSRSKHTGVMAIDVGSVNTLISAGISGKSGTVVKSYWQEKVIDQNHHLLEFVQRWTGLAITSQQINHFLCHYALNPWIVPENRMELTIMQAFTRFRIKNIVSKLAFNYPWLRYEDHKGLNTHFESIIVSGSVLTGAPNSSQTMLMLLDGLQLQGITTVIVDKHHLLPLLGIIADAAPVLPVHMLGSDAFETLGTVVTAVSDVPIGKIVLTVRVTTDAGKDYSLDIIQGELRHLVIPKGVSAVLEFKPTQRTDIGFGSYGLGGELRVTGSALGVVVDARGRPIYLPEDDDGRIEQLQRWQWMLGS